MSELFLMNYLPHSAGKAEDENESIIRKEKNEPVSGFEPLTYSLRENRSTPELHRHLFDANINNIGWQCHHSLVRL